MENLRIVLDDQVSITVDNDQAYLGSDSDTEESSTGSGSGPARFGFLTGGGDGVVRLEEGSVEHGRIEKSFVLGMGRFAKETSVVAIHKKTDSSLMGLARMETFRIFSEAVAKKCGGNANVRFAWYGGSREEIVDVVSHGFSRCGRPKNGGSGGGVGVHLSPAVFSIDSATSSEVDEDGLRHMLLCRVILGKMEPIPNGSNQVHPSSKEFDSGVDNPAKPRRYIVWSAFMNSHIFPNYIISFKSPSLKGSPRIQTTSMRPTSPWMSFPTLMSILSRYLDASKMNTMTKYYRDFRARNISRLQLIRRVRHIAGDDLLVYVIKLERNKAGSVNIYP